MHGRLLSVAQKRKHRILIRSKIAPNNSFALGIARGGEEGRAGTGRGGAGVGGRGGGANRLRVILRVAPNARGGREKKREKKKNGEKGRQRGERDPAIIRFRRSRGEGAGEGGWVERAGTGERSLTRIIREMRLSCISRDCDKFVLRISAAKRISICSSPPTPTPTPPLSLWLARSLARSPSIDTGRVARAM